MAVIILREIKLLIRALGLQETEPPLIDILDRFCPQVLEKCMHLLPQTEKTSILNANLIDLQWITERTCGIWSNGHNDGKLCLSFYEFY